ncbi:IS1634 family transposase [bacterium]|nr:MAG: IS1634 family transposase [bacterium]
MAYVTQKKIKGRIYYYAEESEWKNGKSRRKWQKYLGPVEKIINAVEAKGVKPQYAEVFQLGAPAAYLRVASEHAMTETIDSLLPKREQGLTLGFYLMLAAINRATDPASKRSMWRWFQQTVMLRIFPKADSDALSSQRFWDNMDRIDLDRLSKAWRKIVNSVMDAERIDLSNISFDGTNFYSFISSFNARCSLPKRGKNKQGRGNLRQINYALFCTRKDHLPLFFDVYEGNRHDSKEFGAVIERFFDAFADRRPHRGAMTIVFDKGNNSANNIGAFSKRSGCHFVGSVKPDDHKELALISNNDPRFESLENPRLEDVKAFRARKSIYGQPLTVVVTFNNNLYTAQVQSVNNEINKCLGKLAELTTKLDDRRAGRITRGKAPTDESVKKQVASILSGQYMKRLIDTCVSEAGGLPRLTYRVDSEAVAKLNDTYLGKNIIITDNHDWSNEDIILAYRSQSVIEDVFRQMKDRKTGSWWPMFHWTDHKIQIHGFYCSLALLLKALAMKRADDAGVGMSMNRLCEELSGIREVINVFKKGKKGAATQSVVTKLSETQKKLFDVFGMSKYLSS